MKAIQVFDPALCCSSGVCGVELDQSLVSFSADIDWAKGRGGQIERFNLAQQPMAFADNAAVKGMLESGGQDVLPLIVLDGKVALSGRYPTRTELAQWLGLADTPSTPRAQAATSVNAKLSRIAVTSAPASSCCSPSPGGAATSVKGASKCC